MVTNMEKMKNKAGYTAQDAPSTRLKITRDRQTYGRTYGPTDGQMDTLFYKDVTAHLKTEKKNIFSHHKICEDSAKKAINLWTASLF